MDYLKIISLQVIAILMIIFTCQTEALNIWFDFIFDVGVYTISLVILDKAHQIKYHVNQPE